MSQATAEERLADLLKIIGNKGTCNGCGEVIIWVATKYKKNTPLNADGTSHFKTCPHANEFRKKRTHAP